MYGRWFWWGLQLSECTGSTSFRPCAGDGKGDLRRSSSLPPGRRLRHRTSSRRTTYVTVERSPVPGRPGAAPNLRMGCPAKAPQRCGKPQACPTRVPGVFMWVPREESSVVTALHHALIPFHLFVYSYSGMVELRNLRKTQGETARKAALRIATSGTVIWRCTWWPQRQHCGKRTRTR